MAWFGQRRLHRGLTLAGVLSLIAAYPAWLLWTDNFHVVARNELYRAGQMSAPELQSAVRSKQIHSVLNLRGANPGNPWYDEEVRMSAALGIEHADIALSAKRDVTVEQMAQIEALLQRLPKPILIHCEGGSDRTGFVSALYLHGFEGVPAREASRQLSIWYGHFPYLFKSATSAMDRSFERYASSNSNRVSPVLGTHLVSPLESPTNAPPALGPRGSSTPPL